MKDFKQIEKCDVWPHLQAGKKVYAAVLQSKVFSCKLYDLTHGWDVNWINKILEEDNVVFFEKKENKKDD